MSYRRDYSLDRDAVTLFLHMWVWCRLFTLHYPLTGTHLDTIVPIYIMHSLLLNFSHELSNVPVSTIELHYCSQVTTSEVT